MIYIEITLYSLIQGITEFLPISSSAHLLILEQIFQWDSLGRTLAISAHLGTLIAVLFYLKKELLELITELKKNSNVKFIINLIIMTIPILFSGLLIFKNLDNSLLTLKIVALACIFGGLILYLVDIFIKNSNKTIKELNYFESIIIGILQIFALIPGTSRAGSVITGARLFQINRTEAAKLGLYTGIPTISGAVILETSWLISNYQNYDLIYLVLIVSLSGTFAYFTIKVLIKWLKTKNFLPFFLYRLFLGIIILIFINN